MGANHTINSPYLISGSGYPTKWRRSLGIKPATPRQIFVPPESPFYAPGLLSCDQASFCALGSTFCTPTKLNLHLISPTKFFKCSKITNLIMITNLMNLV